MGKNLTYGIYDKWKILKDKKPKITKKTGSSSSRASYEQGLARGRGRGKASCLRNSEKLTKKNHKHPPFESSRLNDALRTRRSCGLVVSVLSKNEKKATGRCTLAVRFLNIIFPHTHNRVINRRLVPRGNRVGKHFCFAVRVSTAAFSSPLLVFLYFRRVSSAARAPSRPPPPSTRIRMCDIFSMNGGETRKHG